MIARTKVVPGLPPMDSRANGHRVVGGGDSPAQRRPPRRWRARRPRAIAIAAVTAASAHSRPPLWPPMPSARASTAVLPPALMRASQTSWFWVRTGPRSVIPAISSASPSPAIDRAARSSVTPPPRPRQRRDDRAGAAPPHRRRRPGSRHWIVCMPRASAASTLQSRSSMNRQRSGATPSRLHVSR